MKRTIRRIGAAIGVCLVIWVALVAIAVTRADMHRQEQVAEFSMQRLNEAQGAYHSQYGRYATSLAELAMPASGVPSESAAGLLSGPLATGQLLGYRFMVAGTPGGYTIHAHPVEFGGSGSLAFYSDQSLVIRRGDRR
jgi:hypothetical protein